MAVDNVDGVGDVGLAAQGSGLPALEEGAVAQAPDDMGMDEAEADADRGDLAGDVEALGTSQPTVRGERYGDFRMLLPAIKVKSFRFTSTSDAV